MRFFFLSARFNTFSLLIGENETECARQEAVKRREREKTNARDTIKKRGKTVADSAAGKNVKGFHGVAFTVGRPEFFWLYRARAHS